MIPNLGYREPNRIGATVSCRKPLLMPISNHRHFNQLRSVHMYWLHLLTSLSLFHPSLAWLPWIHESFVPLMVKAAKGPQPSALKPANGKLKEKRWPFALLLSRRKQPAAP